MTRRGLILFGSLGVAWGIPYLFIKIAVGELAPEVVVLSRSALAAVLLLPIAAFRHEIAPVLRRWRPMLVYTVVEMVIPWYLLSSAETRLPSSTTGLLIAAVPLAGIAVAWALGKPTQFRGWNWLGIAVGMAGVGALVGFDVHGSNLSAVAEVAVVVVGYAMGPAILAHWVPELPGVGVTAVSLAAVAVIYMPFVALRGSWPTEWPSGGVVTSIVVLAVVCSALAFVLMIALIGEIGPVRSTAITYVNPAVAVFAGVLFLSERLTIWKVLGLALVLGGSALATRHRPIPAVPLDPTVDEALAATGR